MKNLIFKFRVRKVQYVMIWGDLGAEMEYIIYNIFIVMFVL